MELPHNFILLILAGLCLVGQHWFPELTPLTYILLALINPNGSVSTSASRAINPTVAAKE